MVNDLLETIKLQQGNSPLRKDTINISAFICDIYPPMKVFANSEGIDLILEADKSIHYIEGDIQALEKIFNNLINNAIKFTSHGGVIHIKIIQDKE